MTVKQPGIIFRLYLFKVILSAMYVVFRNFCQVGVALKVALYSLLISKLNPLTNRLHHQVMSGLLDSLYLFVFFLCLILFLTYVLPVEYLKCVAPHPFPCWPILGNLFSVVNFKMPVNEAMTAMELKWSKVYYNVGYFVLFITWRPILYVLDGNLMQSIMKNSDSIDKSSEYLSLKPWLGDGLITSNGHVWKKHRKLLNPTFSTKLINSFVPLINKEARNLVRKLIQESANKPWIDIRPFISNFALRVVSSTIMGVEIDETDTQNQEYLDNVKALSSLVVQRAFNPLLKLNIVYDKTTAGSEAKKSLKYLHDLTMNILNERRSDPIEKNNNVKSLMDVLLEGNELGNLTGQEIREEIDTFMLAGHDAPSMAIMWTTFLLGLNPTVQEKIHSEVQCIVGSEFDRDVTMDELQRMTYIDKVIKEGLRMYPPIPRVGRVSNEDLKLDDGTCIKKGTNLIIPLYLIHRNPVAFDHPENFDPDRFDNLSEKGKMAYAPFAGGPRNCIAQRFAQLEMKLVLVHIFSQVKVKSLDQDSSIERSLDVVQKPVSPLRLQIAKLNLDYN